MNFKVRRAANRTRLIALSMAVCCITSLRLPSLQSQDSNTAPPATSPPDLLHSNSPDPLSKPPPPPPNIAVKPPIEFFRELLAMGRTERNQVLARRPAESQKLINAKLLEYDALPAEERELRLRVTELRYYLLPLMSLAPTNRGASLERMPAEIRLLVEQRLARWDGLSPAEQKELLDNQVALQHLTQLPRFTAQALTNLPAESRQSLLAKIRRWEQLPDGERQVIARRFEEYFSLTPAEKERTLRTLSEAERLQIEKTLETFGKLDRDRRAQCLRALNKLAQMTSTERQAFLKSAEEWRRLSPDERKSWRTLVYNLSRLPPLPKGVHPPGPPLPPVPGPNPPRATVATNG